MAIIKCKMCGGDLELKPDATVAECEYCGSMQMGPNQDNEKKLTLFARANRLRAACEFDKAAGVYESIVAEFPEEAEAYWGLVLCKFGIEYVDDPATGRKIPTCHRSSFDSILDPNFEQAQENTDVVARKVMRDEAKVIEGIRKRIIEVSSKEEPYDIFICYKETAADGGRTVDSVLAQDIYNALTERDYRVFFARITLVEDALGKEYEPFIFAALNSAPVMLAIGTDYEHFNAVWVKNEWSRFLQMKEAGMNKTLIPCFKDIDAYDLPKEFQALQAQDLGKVGGMQDLLAGIEKILPRKKAAQTVVEVQRGVSPNVESLLKRGNIFLEDKDWANADKYFDDVLDIDPECAEAYLGKSLTQHRCLRADGLVLASLKASSAVDNQKITAMEHDRKREMEIVQRYSMPGFVDSQAIYKLFKCEMTYLSEAAGRKQQRAEEERWFEQDKYMGRAMRYAKGQTKALLESLKLQILNGMDERIQRAVAADEAADQQIHASYEATLVKADEEGKRLYAAGEVGREETYQACMLSAEKAVEVNKRKEMQKARENLKPLGDYKQAAMMCTILDEKIAVIDAANEAERKRREAEERKAAEIRKAYEKELPEMAKRPQVEKELKEKRKKADELTKSLQKTGGFVFCLVFFILGIFEVFIGLMDDDFEIVCMYLGAFAAVIFGIATVMSAGSRVQNRKKLKDLRDEIAADEKWLRDMDGCMTLEEFTRVYELRQSEEGRAQLEEEARERQKQERLAQKAALRAQKQRTRKMIIMTSIIIAVVVAIAVGLWYLTAHVIPSGRISAAEKAMAANDYQTAYDELSQNGDYKNTLELREQIAQHGEYQIASIFENRSSYKLDDYYYFYEYDAKGQPVAVTQYKDDEVEKNDNGEYTFGDVYTSKRYSYDYYPSGNLKTCKAYDGKTNKLSMTIVFYDDAKSAAVCMPVYANLPENTGNTYQHHIYFYGVKRQAFYDADGKANRAYEYSLEGANLAKGYTLDEEGRLASYDYNDDNGVRTLTYNEDGTVAKLVYDDDTSSSKYDSDDESWKYEYKYNANGTLKLRNGKEGYSDTPKWQLEYTYDNKSSQLTELKISEKDGSELETTVTYKMEWAWCNFAEAEAKAAEQQAALDEAVAAAEKLMSQGKYEEAIAAYEALITYSASQEKIQEARYLIASDLMTSGKTNQAYKAFKELGDYKDSAKKAQENWTAIMGSRNTNIAMGEKHLVAIQQDGTVKATGIDSNGSLNVSDWKDIVSVAAGESHTVGLKADGTVVAVGSNTYSQCSGVKNLKDIAVIRAWGNTTATVTKDGKVLIVGLVPNNAAVEKMMTWTDIVDVFANQDYIVGLRKDGTMVYAQGRSNSATKNVTDWKEVIGVWGEEETVGVVKADGTVEYGGFISNASSKVKNWVNYKQIQFTREGIIGLKNDGMVVAVGKNKYNELRRAESGAIDIAASGYNTAIVMEGGSVHVFGQYAKKMDTTGWQVKLTK